jgi:hypothetical protein
MARVRRDLALLLPGGFVVLAALVLLRPGVTPEAVRPYIDVCAVVVLVLGVLLGWHHGRSRIIFALVLLGVADATLWWLARHEAVGGDPGRTIISALAVLLPVNLAAYSALPERDPATARGFARLLPILAQVAVVGLMVRAGVPALRAWMDQRWLDGGRRSRRSASQRSPGPSFSSRCATSCSGTPSPSASCGRCAPRSWRCMASHGGGIPPVSSLPADGCSSDRSWKQRAAGPRTIA